ncbi:MAG: APC family permease [Chloroflexi bacterium]|nr:APC family permease [Chloroflexota bacterium]
MKIDSTSGATILEPGYDQTPPKSWRSWLIGNPLSTADAPNQTIGKLIGLAVFASDALSSTAYASQEILIILAYAGSQALGFVFPISLAIVTLMAIVSISYEQTIHAYPGGGGAYIVARDNLGELPAQTAGAALLTDYILTVAVSISSGVAQIVSAFPRLFPYRVEIAVGMVLFIMLVNLRGVKESGMAFAIPTYFFVATMFITVGVGFFRYFTGTLGSVINPPELETAGMVATAVTPFLLLHAFSSGTAALTGIEAISNGITAFKEPRSKNAGITLVWMSGILASLFLGISFLIGPIHAVPSEQETVISQLARTVFGGQGALYLALIGGTAVILIMAANTAFADFPRLSALHAGDGFLPRQMTFKGSRLVFSRGIVTLAAISSLLIIVFQASVTRLIPLYAIGVFLSFTLSQAGMAKRWWKSGHLKPGEEVVEPGSVITYDKNWLLKLVINGFGALCTAMVMVVFAITKFKDGAWIIIILVPVLVTIFFRIHHHYKHVADKLSLQHYHSVSIKRHRVIVLIAGVHRGSLAALTYARMLSDDVTSLHVSTDPLESKKVREKWEMYGEGTRLVMLESPYRLLIEPVMNYIEQLLNKRMPNEIITVVVPQFVPKHWWENFLHSQTAMMLRMAFMFKPGLVIIEVPYQI